MASEEIALMTIAEMAPRLKRKEVSPVEVTRVHLERIGRLNGRLNAYLTVSHDEAIAAAQAAEQEIVRGHYRGPLHGIPVALKDIFAVKGVRMTCGSKILADHVSEADATVVKRLAQAGAVLLGKLNMHEFAWGGTSINPHYGTPRNPWDLEYIPGGSSGGSAVAVAASLAMASLGTDTGGSVRIPAALSGIVGLKPTYGRVSRAGVYPLCWSLDHVGPMAKRVEDVALLMQVIAGHDSHDPTTSRLPVPNYTAALTRDIRGLRLGVPKDYFFEDLEPAVRDGIDTSIQQLCGLGAVAEEVSLPLMRYVPGGSYAIMVAESYAVHEHYLQTRAQDYGADVRSRLMLGAYVSAPQYLKAQRFRELLRQETMQALQRVDVLVTPTAVITAKRIDEPVVRIGGKEIVVASHLSRLTRPFNLTGLPAISLPCGFTGEGLPIGLQIIGRPFDEATVLRVAHAYECSTPWHKRRPACESEQKQ